MAASLAGAGYQVAVADLFADYDTARIAQTWQLPPDPRQAIQWLAQTNVDAWCYTGGLENYPRIVRRLAALRPLLGVTADELQKIRQPSWLAHFCKRQGLLFPAWQPAHQVPPADQGEWLLKPYRSGGGLRIISPGAQGPGRGVYWQRRIDGPAMSVAVLSTPTEVEIVGGCRLRVKSQTKAPFLFAGGTTLTSAELGQLEEVDRFVRLLHREVPLVGLWGVDFILAKRPYFLEVNPRWTASMALHERGTSASLARCHLDAWQGRPVLPPCRITNEVHAMQVVYAPQSVTVSKEAVHRLDQHFDLSPERIVHRPRLADVPRPGTTIAAGHPVCTLYADGDSAEQVETQLAQQVETLWRLVEIKP